jgi:hypothetical protein
MSSWITKVSLSYPRLDISYMATGTCHGFAARPNMEYEEIKSAYEGATEQTVNWFKKTIF